MKANHDSKAVRWSAALYRRLLFLYPRAYRQQYGAPMVQLFRDQCRETCPEPTVWKWISLWGRTLPDLLKSAVIEHYAHWKGSPLMLEKLMMRWGNKLTPGKAFSRVFATGFLLFFIAALVITSLLPTAYSSMARVAVVGNELRGERGKSPFNRRDEFALIQSLPVLEQVVARLDLQNRWGKRYGGSEALSLSDTAAMLKNSISLRPVSTTSLIEIQAYSPDKDEAAAIANAVALVYQEVRASRQMPLADSGKLPITASGSVLASRVEIVDQAEPRPIPARPNKVANLILSFLGGGFFGGGLGLVAALLAGYFRRRRLPPKLFQSRTGERI